MLPRVEATSKLSHNILLKYIKKVHFMFDLYYQRGNILI